MNDSLKRKRTAEDLCAICLDPLQGNCVTLPCGHRFDSACVGRYQASGGSLCPLCRARIVPQEVEDEIMEEAREFASMVVVMSRVLTHSRNCDQEVCGCYPLRGRLREIRDRRVAPPHDTSALHFGLNLHFVQCGQADCLPCAAHRAIGS